MNTLFSLDRFLRLLKAHWVENRHQYLWFVVISVIIDIIFYIIIFSVNGAASHTYKTLQYSGQIGWYTTGLFMTGSIFAGLYFRHLSNPGPALITLMRPASIFEKWLLTITVVSFLFPLVYTIFYFLLQYPAVQLASSLYVAPEKCKNCTPDFSLFVPFFTVEAITDAKEAAAALMIRTQVFTLICFWILQSILLGGTAYFKQSPILRTVLLMFLLMLILSSFIPSPPVKPFWSASPEQLILFSALEKLNSILIWVGLLGILWAALFYHLKEREVT